MKILKDEKLQKLDVLKSLLADSVFLLRSGPLNPKIECSSWEKPVKQVVGNGSNLGKFGARKKLFKHRSSGTVG